MDRLGFPQPYIFPVMVIAVAVVLVAVVVAAAAAGVVVVVVVMVQCAGNLEQLLEQDCQAILPHLLHLSHLGARARLHARLVNLGLKR